MLFNTKRLPSTLFNRLYLKHIRAIYTMSSYVKHIRAISTISSVLERDLGTELDRTFARPLRTIDPNVSLYQAAETMINFRTGALIVAEGTNMFGIITERDFIKWSKESNADIQSKLIDFMTPVKDIKTMSCKQSLAECMLKMFEENMRHMPLYHDTAKDNELPDTLINMRDIARQILWWNEQGNLPLPQTVNTLLQQRRISLTSMESSDSVLQAIHLMNKENIGCVVVMPLDELGGVQENLSIFSERDFLFKGLHKNINNLDNISLSEVATPASELISVGPHHSVTTCLRLMLKMGFRHLPIIEGDKCLGIFSLRTIVSELLFHYVDEQQ